MPGRTDVARDPGGTGRLIGARPRLTWLVLGALLVVLDLVLLVPGNRILDLNQRRYQSAGTVLAHTGAVALLAAVWPCRHRWLAAAARARPRARLAAVAAAAVLPQILLLGIGLRWPAYGHALTREWAPVEAAGVAAFLVAAWLARETARVRRARGLVWRPDRLAMLGCVLFALEEMDYFGVPGALIGRVGGVYVGTLHDLVNLATWHPDVLPVLLGAAGVALVVLWRVGDLSWRFLWTEARSASTAIIALAAGVVLVAEVIDVTARVPSGLTWLFRSDAEEPLELLGAVLLSAGILARYCRNRDVGGRRVP